MTIKKFTTQEASKSNYEKAKYIDELNLLWFSVPLKVPELEAGASCINDESNDNLTQTIRETGSVIEVLEEEEDDKKEAGEPGKVTVSDDDSQKKLFEEHNTEEANFKNQEIACELTILTLVSGTLTVTDDASVKITDEVHEKEVDKIRKNNIQPSASETVTQSKEMNVNNGPEIDSTDLVHTSTKHLKAAKVYVEKELALLNESVHESSTTKTVPPAMQINDMNLATVLEKETTINVVQEKKVTAPNLKKKAAVLKLSEMHSEFLKMVQSDPGPLAILLGLGLSSFSRYAYRITTNGASTRQYETSPIIISEESCSSREVFVCPYPALPTTTGTSITRREIFYPPTFVPNNLAFVTHQGNVNFVIVTQLFGWKCINTSENEMRASVTVVHGENGLIMDPMLTGSPYKFDKRNLNVFHKNGDTIIVKVDESYLLGVVTDDFCYDDPLYMNVTFVTSLRKDSDDVTTVDLEIRKINRWGCFMKSVRCIFYFILAFFFFIFFLFF